MPCQSSLSLSLSLSLFRPLSLSSFPPASHPTHIPRAHVLCLSCSRTQMYLDLSISICFYLYAALPSQHQFVPPFSSIRGYILCIHTCAYFCVCMCNVCVVWANVCVCVYSLCAQPPHFFFNKVLLHRRKNENKHYLHFFSSFSIFFLTAL